MTQAKSTDKKSLKKAQTQQHPALMDAHRETPKTEGGDYDPGNVTLLDPITHLKEHGNFKDRSEGIAAIKTLFEARSHALKSKVAADNRLTAIHRGVDEVERHTFNLLNHVSQMFKKEEQRLSNGLAKHVRRLAAFDELTRQCLQIQGLGEVTIAYLLVYVDIEKADTVSKLWSYAGLHLPSHQRYQKGEKGGGNKPLRTALYAFADSVIKTRGAYRCVYDAEKERLANSEKVTQTRNTQGKMVECAWKDTKPSHRDGAAKRKLIKHFLADFLYVARRVNDLPVRNIYAEDQLGHENIVHPNERGWQIDIDQDQQEQDRADLFNQA